MYHKKVKALVLLSGGLDSILAVKILQSQNIKVTGVCFVSNFFGSEKAEIAAKNLNIELKIIDISKEMIEIVRNPKNGHGKNLNPCIDCHGFMFKTAWQKLNSTSLQKSNFIINFIKSIFIFLSLPMASGKCGKILSRKNAEDLFNKKSKYDFIATGEVLGQRPFSQNKTALRRVEKIAGIEILRPLSAKLLPETSIERKKIVQRDKLFDIQGRTRIGQTKLIKKYKIKDYPSPAGGCLLTDPSFSQRLAAMLEKWPECTPGDIEFLKHGRVFWLNYNYQSKLNSVLIIIGRHNADNKILKKIKQENDLMIELKNIPGPVTIVRNLNISLDDKKFNNLSIPSEMNLDKINFTDYKNKKDILNTIFILTGYYSPKARGKKVDFVVKG